jgi:hypothetical protein
LLQSRRFQVPGAETIHLALFTSLELATIDNRLVHVSSAGQAQLTPSIQIARAVEVFGTSGAMTPIDANLISLLPFTESEGLARFARGGIGTTAQLAAFGPITARRRALLFTR